MNEQNSDLAAAKVLADAVIAKALVDKPTSAYTNREVDLLLKEQNNRMDYQDDLLEKIDTKVTTTNGSVASLQKWREQMVGAIKLTGFIGLAGFVGLVIFWLKLFSK